MDWNSIVLAGTGGLVGVLGGVLTQVMQGSRERRKAYGERAATGAAQVLEEINSLHDLFWRSGYNVFHGEQDPDEPGEHLGSPEFAARTSKMIVSVLVIPDARARQVLARIISRLHMIGQISSRVGTDDDQVGRELCEYAREVVGRYLRGQRARRSLPPKIREYLRAADQIEEEWERSRASLPSPIDPFSNESAVDSSADP